MAASEFTIPVQPSELVDEDCSYEIRVTLHRRVADLDKEDAKRFAQGALYELCNESALGITEQDLFNKVYSLVEGFGGLDSVNRKRLIDSLCSNLSVLCVSISSLVADDDDEVDESATTHCSALKAYTFFLWWICSQAEQEHREAAPGASTTTAAGRGRAKKTGGHDLGQWDWDVQQEKLLRCLGSSAEIDLWKLFRPKNPDSRLLQTWLKVANLVLESPSAIRNKGVKEASFRMLAAMALKYQQLDVIAGALIDLLNKFEHLSTILAELAVFASQHYDDPRLGVEMLREVTSVDPLEYDQQQKEDAAGIRNVAIFIQELAERLPKDVAANISLLIPHLGGKAYTLRSAIVTATGHLIQSAFGDPGEGEEADAQGTAARLRSKQHLLDTLVERARDQSAYTRARVMQTWSILASSRNIDMGHWLCVTELAIGRLEDKAALVRRQALNLLTALLSFNPFAPSLPEAKFVATLEEYQKKLAELQPQAAEQEPQAMMTETDIKAEAEAESPLVPGPTDQGATQASQEAPSGEIAKLRTTVACMDAAVGFIRAVSGMLGMLTQLLASATVSDVTEAIQLLVMCDKFEIVGAQTSVRQMLPLIFSREQGVKDAVLGAIDELCIGDMQPKEAAERLICLANGLNLGELSSLEEIMKQLLVHQPPLLKPPVLSALWGLVEAASKNSSNPREAGVQLRCAMQILAMAANSQPVIVAARLDLLVKVGFGDGQGDALVVRAACACLQQLAALQSPPPAHLLEAARRGLAAVLVGGNVRGEGWYAAAESALRAAFTLFPAPTAFCQAVLRRLATTAFGGLAGDAGDEEEGLSASATAISHFFFALGQVALQQLVCVENTASAIRKKRLDLEKQAAEAQADGAANQGHEEDDIAAQIGAGSAAAEGELDALKDAAESQILSSRNLVGQFAGIVTQFCHNRALMDSSSVLRSSALLALTKLMALDTGLCDQNLQLVFTLLHNRSVEPAIRSNLVIAVGDLAFRFPNLLEPWTHNIYEPLSDPDKGVVKNSLMVLTHLILNDMMKVRSHISRLAICLLDSDTRIAALAQLFFHELSRKAFKGTNPIYNLLPDILSNLSGESGLPQKGFQDIMRSLLPYIGKEKHADSLVEKLCARFASTEDASQWRNLSFCISQLSYTEKGVRKLIELLKCYQAALLDDEVLDHFQGVLAKAKKMPKQSPDFKTDVEAFEKVLIETATELQEQDATAKAAQKKAKTETRQSGSKSGEGMDTDDVTANASNAVESMQTESEALQRENPANPSGTLNTQAGVDFEHQDPENVEPSSEADMQPQVAATQAQLQEPSPPQSQPDGTEASGEAEASKISNVSNATSPQQQSVTTQLGKLALRDSSRTEPSSIPRSVGRQSGASRRGASKSPKRKAEKRAAAHTSRQTALPAADAVSELSLRAGLGPEEERFADENNSSQPASSNTGASANLPQVKVEAEEGIPAGPTNFKAMRKLWEQRALLQPAVPGRRIKREQ